MNYYVSVAIIVAGIVFTGSLLGFVIKKLCQVVKGIKKPALGGLKYSFIGFVLYTLLVFMCGAVAAGFYDTLHSSIGSNTATFTATARVGTDGKPQVSIARDK